MSFRFRNTAMASRSKPNNYNYKGRSPNVLRYIESCGAEADISSLLPATLLAGARLAAKNECQALDETTARTYELRLLCLEEFAITNGDDAELFGENKRPFMVATLQTYFQMLSERKGKKLGALVCKGLKPPVIKGHAAAFRYWFNTFGHTGPYKECIVTLENGSQKIIPSGNPMNAPAIKLTMKQLIKRSVRPSKRDARHGRTPYEPKKASPFKVEQLLRMREYCLKSIEGLRGLWLWTVTLFSFALFLRGEEPLRLKVKHLKLPSNYDYSSNKLPQRLEVKIPWSKCDKKAKGVTLSLWSNPLNSQLCPVTALYTWLLITGQRKGYIFPRVKQNNRYILPHSRRGVASYRKVYREMCASCLGQGFSTHSNRRSAARWAARCGADDSTIKRAGRWKSTSTSFELYTQDARAEMIKEHHDGKPVCDHKMWMFKPLR